MKKGRFMTRLRLLIFILFLGAANSVFALPAPSIVPDSAPVHEIRSEQHLNREAVLFSFQQQYFETSQQGPDTPTTPYRFLERDRETSPYTENLQHRELQYLIYSKGIRPSRDGLVLIFPFHTFI
ncbi:MAG: hypothetical protein V7724_07965 [Sediminicola sp.]